MVKSLPIAVISNHLAITESPVCLFWFMYSTFSFTFAFSRLLRLVSVNMGCNSSVTLSQRCSDLHCRQHVGEMRSNAAETGSSQTRPDAGHNKQLPSTAQDIPWHWRQSYSGIHCPFSMCTSLTNFPASWSIFFIIFVPLKTGMNTQCDTGKAKNTQ